MTKKQTTIITALTIIAFILAFLVSNRIWHRFDLTSTRAHTISRVSRNLHTEIPDTVHITYYISNRLRTMIPAPREIEDLLREYAAHSRGRIRVTVRDPARAGLTRVIEEIGIQPVQIQTVDRDQASLITVYSGIVIEYLDRIEVLPWVISTATLEYDLTSRIRAMVTDTERRIGIIVGDSFRQWRTDFGFLGRTLAEAGYRIRLILPGEEIPDNLPALIVLGGAGDLDIFALYRIDRFIQLGGRVLFAVNSIYIDTFEGTLAATAHHDLGLLEMLASYGVIVRQDLALDRSALTLQYQTRMPSGALQFRIIRYPFWINVMGENGNPQHPVTAGFAGLHLYWPNPLELLPPQGVTETVLFTSTQQAWSMPEPFITNPDMAHFFERDAHRTSEVQIFAASLTGKFPSFFGGLNLPTEWGEDLPDMPYSASPARIIVVGDTNFATNLTTNATGAAHNFDFLLRAADWLTSDDDIVNIRNRTPHIGSFDRIIDEEERAAAIRFVKIVNLGLVPLFVIGAGFVIAHKRKKRSLMLCEKADAKTVKGDTDV